MAKRPNTIKMHRLLQQLANCDPRSAKEVRELQDDSRKLLGVGAEQPRNRKAAKTARK